MTNRRPAGARASLGAVAIAGALALAGCSGIPDCTSPAAQALAVDIMAKTTDNKLLATLIYADRRALVAEQMVQYSPETLARYLELCERPGLVFEGEFTKGENESPARCKARIAQQFPQNRQRTARFLAAQYPALADQLNDVDKLLADFAEKLAAAKAVAKYSLSDARATGTIERYKTSSCAATLTLVFGDFGTTSLPVEYDMRRGMTESSGARSTAQSRHSPDRPL